MDGYTNLPTAASMNYGATTVPSVISTNQQGEVVSYQNAPPPYAAPLGGSVDQRNVAEYLSPEEINALNIMRQQMQNNGFNLPDERLVQALMARKFEVDRAVLLLKNQLEWKQAHASDLILDEKIMKELRTCKVLAPPNSRDKTGAQIIYFCPRFHQPHESTPYDVFRMVYYLIDHLVEDITTQRSGFMIIVDLRGAAWRNFESKLPQVFVKNMQNRFPGRLHLILILHPPKIFRVMYSMVKPFVPDKYLAKIQVVDLANLPQYVDPNNLLQDYGGSLAFDQSSFINMLVTQEQYKQQSQLQLQQQQMQQAYQEVQQQKPQLQQQQQFVGIGTAGL